MSRIPFIRKIVKHSFDDFKEAYEMDMENNPYSEEHTFGDTKDLFKRMIFIIVNHFKLSEYEEYYDVDCEFVLFQHLQELYIEKLEEYIDCLENGEIY